MNGRDLRDQYLRIADLWLCEGSSLDIRYVALKAENGWVLSGASVSVGPVPYKFDYSFEVESSQLIVGCQQIPSSSRDVAMKALLAALEGRVEVRSVSLPLRALDTIDWYSEAPNRETWLSPLHIRVSSRSNEPPLHPQVVANIEDELRRGAVPFDGLSDVSALLGVRTDVSGSRSPSIEVTLSPPVDLILNECSLKNDHFSGVLVAHQDIDAAAIALAIRAVPGENMQARRQVASSIAWDEAKDGLRRGAVSLDVPQSESILVMLSFGGRTIRRNWFVDPQKASNSRYVSMIQSDPELRMLRRAAFEDQDSRRLELAVSGLLYMLGFSSALPAEQNSPDILGHTPGGAVLIVECTTRIADFHSKVGKLVERRSALSKTLAAANLPANVTAALVCRLSSDEIPVASQELSERGILLFSREDIEAAFRRVRFVQDPDALLQEWIGGGSSGGING